MRGQRSRSEKSEEKQIWVSQSRPQAQGRRCGWTGRQAALGLRELPVGLGWEASCTHGGQRWWGIAISDGVGVLELSLRDLNSPHSAPTFSVFAPGQASPTKYT